MRLSLSWLIVLLLLVYIAFFFSYGWSIYESFRDTTIEGFQTTTDISLTSCPPSEIDESTPMKALNAAGTTQTWCYDSDVKKCSLSVSRSDPSSCSQYYLALLQSKAKTRCPATMPNYFQHINYSNNVDKSVRGCSAGARTADGKSPASMTDSHCTIYTRQKDDLEKLDSCTNIKRLQSARCFSTGVAGVTTALQANSHGSPLVQCTFSQIESVKKGSKTVNENAEAEKAQAQEIVKQTAENNKWERARTVVANLAKQGPVRVQPRLNLPVKYVFLSQIGDQTINISQIVVRDINGVNITKSAMVFASTEDYGTKKETAVDGYEGPRPYPSIYHSKNGGGEWFELLFPTPVVISSVTIYNRSDCCNSRISSYRLVVRHTNGDGREFKNLTADLTQTYSFIPPIVNYSGQIVQAKYVTTDIFSPESVRYTCTELQSYRSWIDSIKNLYPEMYAASSYNLDSSETWSDDKKNSFCSILERTKIIKSMSDTELKAVSVL